MTKRIGNPAKKLCATVAAPLGVSAALMYCSSHFQEVVSPVKSPSTVVSPENTGEKLYNEYENGGRRFGKNRRCFFTHQRPLEKGSAKVIGEILYNA